MTLASFSSFKWSNFSAKVSILLYASSKSCWTWSICTSRSWRIWFSCSYTLVSCSYSDAIWASSCCNVAISWFACSAWSCLLKVTASSSCLMATIVFDFMLVSSKNCSNLVCKSAFEQSRVIWIFEFCSSRLSRTCCCSNCGLFSLNVSKCRFLFRPPSFLLWTSSDRAGLLHSGAAVAKPSWFYLTKLSRLWVKVSASCLWWFSTFYYLN